MAKEKTTKKAEKDTAPKYGVEDLADEMDIQPASLRVRLRNANVDKNGKSYGWNSEKEMLAVKKQLDDSAGSTKEKTTSTKKKVKVKTKKTAAVKKAA